MDDGRHVPVESTRSGIADRKADDGRLPLDRPLGFDAIERELGQWLAGDPGARDVRRVLSVLCIDGSLGG
jgi:hypothetical protein